MSASMFICLFWAKKKKVEQKPFNTGLLIKMDFVHNLRFLHIVPYLPLEIGK